MSEFKSCPFCGNQLVFGEVAIGTIPVVTCSGCSLIVDLKTAYLRTPPPATAKILKEFRRVLDEHLDRPNAESQCARMIFWCSELQAILAEWERPCA